MAFNFQYDFGGDDDEDDEYPFWIDALEGIGGMPNYLLDVDMDDLLYENSPEDPYDFFYSDDDDDDGSSYSADTDHDHNKIFVSLQDSHVLKRLGFHKTVGRCRLPRVRTEKPETYESLYHVLEELEILMKVWRKRTSHPFTAHIHRGDADQNESKVQDDEAEDKDPRFGVDYSDQDMEHESDSEQETFFAASGINETLTKKKYCQSTKMLYDIFENDKKFDNFLSYIRLIRKYIYRIIFSLFHDNLPVEVARKLPDELWEKVWKFTQMQYDEDSALHVGTKAQGEAEVELENDRITELFGSVGNFHMLVFEILFKHSYISVPSPLLELESLEVWTSNSTSRVSYVKSQFNFYQKNLEKHFCRLQDLHLGSISMNEVIEDDSFVDVAGNKQLIKLTDSGRYFLHRQKMEPVVHGKVLADCPSLTNDIFITAQFFNNVVAFLDGSELKDNKESLVTVVLWNVAKNLKIATIRTGIRYLSAVYGVNQNTPQHLFALSNKRFAFVIRDSQKEKDSFVLYQWSYDPDSTEMQNLDESHCHKLIHGDLERTNGGEPFNGKAMFYLKAFDSGDQCTYAICYQNPYLVHSSVHLYNATTGTELEGSLSFPEQQLSLEGFKSNRAFLKDATRREFSFCDVANGKTIATYPYLNLCKDADHDHEKGLNAQSCVYEVKLDQSPDRLQFILFGQNFTCFQLFQYEDEPGDDGIPQVIASGSTLVLDLSWRVMSMTTLVDGCLFLVSPRDVHLRTHSGDYYLDDIDIYGLNILALDCANTSVHPVASMLINTDDHAKAGDQDKGLKSVLMNEYSRRFFASKTKSYAYFCNENTLLLPMHQSFLMVKYCESAKEVMETEMKQLLVVVETRKKRKKEEQAKLEKARKQQEAALKKLEQKRLEMEAAKELFVDKEEDLQGKIIKWTNTYGFIQLFNSQAKPLGNIFVHISDIVNRGSRRMKTGLKVEFRIIRQPQDKMKAINVNILPNPK